MNDEPILQSRRYIVYDSDTGEIIAVHDVGLLEEDVLPTMDEVREQLRGLLDQERLDKAGLLEVDDTSPGVQHFVDPGRRELRRLRRIEIQADKSELHGDGEDSAELRITVVDPDSGKVDKSFSDQLLVTTTRGRLSEPGGRIEARNGRAAIRLVSAPETVRQVQVVVEATHGRAAPAIAELEFL
jgi:hypothetical protein